MCEGDFYTLYQREFERKRILIYITYSSHTEFESSLLSAISSTYLSALTIASETTDRLI